MTGRAISLLGLGSPSFVLDVGCGSGLSGCMLSSTADEEGGPHVWMGMDISSAMLSTALERGDEVEGDLMLSDVGQGLPFRPGTFDGAISISAIQWLCNADSTDVSPQARLTRFFNTLYASLRRGARAVCQFYPRNDAQRHMISSTAIRAGFGAGLLEDHPGTKNAKLFLVLTVGGGDVGGKGKAGDITGVVKGMDDVDILDPRPKSMKIAAAAATAGVVRAKAGGRGQLLATATTTTTTTTTERKGSRRWILRKKSQMERKGKVVKPSSKYTGRSRRPKF